MADAPTRILDPVTAEDIAAYKDAIMTGILELRRAGRELDASRKKADEENANDHAGRRSIDLQYRVKSAAHEAQLVVLFEEIDRFGGPESVIQR